MSNPTITPAETVDPSALMIWPHMHYVDLVTIMLTCVGLLATGLAIMIALLALVGMGQIRRSAANRAVEVATKALDNHLSSDTFNNKVDEVIERKVRDTVLQAVNVTFKEGGRSDDSSTDAVSPFKD